MSKSGDNGWGASIYDVRRERGEPGGGCQEMQQISGHTVQILRIKKEEGILNTKIQWTSYMEAPCSCVAIKAEVLTQDGCLNEEEEEGVRGRRRPERGAITRSRDATAKKVG